MNKLIEYSFTKRHPTEEGYMVGEQELLTQTETKTIEKIFKKARTLRNKRVNAAMIKAGYEKVTKR